MQVSCLLVCRSFLVSNNKIIASLVAAGGRTSIAAIACKRRLKRDKISILGIKSCSLPVITGKLVITTKKEGSSQARSDDFSVAHSATVVLPMSNSSIAGHR